MDHPEFQDDVFSAPRPQGVLPDLPGEVNLLPISILDRDLRVEFDKWALAPDQPGRFAATVFLYWDSVEVDSKEFEYPTFDPNQLFLLVPREKLLESGVHTLRYRIESFLYDDTSIITPVLIDWRAPSYNQTPAMVLLPAEVISNGLTPEYLDAHGHVLLVQIPHYSDTREGDEIELYWQSTPQKPGEDAPFWQHTVTAAEANAAQNDPDAVIDLLLPQANILGRGEGLKVLQYQLSDRAGNTSAMSRTTALNVTLLPAPVLPAPQVPAANDGLVTRADAQQGVDVLIPAYAFDATDSIAVHWGGQYLTPQPVGAVPVFPLIRRVPWEVMAVGDHAEVRHDVPVRYSVLRAGIGWGSQTQTVTVDFSVAGPPNPGIDPVNPLLPRATVKGVQGDNVVGLPDSDQPLRVEVALYADPAEGQQLDLFWGLLPAPVASYRVQPGDVAGQTIVFQVPWQDVLAGGNGNALPVRYTTFNGINGQQSPDTAVAVAVVFLEGLPLPVFPDRDPFFFIACAQRPWNGIRIQIPADPRFGDGDQLQLHWEGYEGTDLTGARILGHTFNLTLDDTAATEGVKFVLEDFDGLILPLGFKRPGLPSSKQDGSGEAWYTLIKRNGEQGSSQRREAYCSIGLVGAGANCPCTHDDYLEDDTWCLPAG